jgi:phosphodiesterase/alkaline phosphatase D-like protein
MNLRINTILIISFFTLVSCQTNVLNGPYLGTGIKMGEVTQSETIIWTRLTETAERVGNDALMPDIKYTDPVSKKIMEMKKTKEIRLSQE